MDIMAMLQSSVDNVNSGSASARYISKAEKKVAKSTISLSVGEKKETDAGKRKAEFPVDENNFSVSKEKKHNKSSVINDEETVIVTKKKKKRKKEKHRKEKEREEIYRAEEDAIAVCTPEKKKKSKFRKEEEELSMTMEADAVNKKKHKKEEEDTSPASKVETLVVDNVNNLEVGHKEVETGAATKAKKRKEKEKEPVSPSNREETATVKKEKRKKKIQSEEKEEETRPTDDDQAAGTGKKVKDKGEEKVKKVKCPKSLALEKGPEPSWELGATPRQWGGATVGGQKVAKVRTFKGTHYVDIREYYADPLTWEFKPGQKGVSLTRDQFERLRTFLPQISSAALPCPDDDPLA